MEPLTSTDHPLITYEGPQSLSTLTCKQCETNFLTSGPLKIKGAPSENWREVIELWQCHNESFDTYVNADTREIQVPSNLTLAYFNTLILAKDALVNMQGPILRCNKCQNVIGFTQNQQRSVFLSTIKETQGIPGLEQLHKYIKSHGMDNQKQDMLFVDVNRSKMVKVKIVNHKVMCSQKEGEELDSCIKIFYNVATNLNPDVLRLLEEINKTYIVTEAELQVSKIQFV